MFFTAAFGDFFGFFTAEFKEFKGVFWFFLPQSLGSLSQFTPMARGELGGFEEFFSNKNVIFVLNFQNLAPHFFLNLYLNLHLKLNTLLHIKTVKLATRNTFTAAFGEPVPVYPDGSGRTRWFKGVF